MKLTQRPASRRTVLRSLALGTTGLTAFAIVGCGNDDDEDEMMDDEMMTETPMASETATEEMMETPMASETAMGSMTQPLISGWYRDEAVRYYDFGLNSEAMGSSVSVAPIYAFITGMSAAGEPMFVDGQHNVVGVVPGDAGYSDLWEVHLVTVPADYEADTIRSAADVEASGYEMEVPGLFVNCPIVEPGTELEGGEELVQGWYENEEVFYPDFGENAPVAIPIWAFATGMDADGNPEFVDGQHNIIDAVPTDTGYSAFWRVNLVMVDDMYEADSIRSAADVGSSGYEVMETDLVVNCPVTEF